MPSTVGRVQRDRPRSVKASMDRKRYIGSWSEGSVLMIKRMVQLPRIETRYRRHRRMEIQICRCSRPGMPVSRKVEERLLLFSKNSRVIACAEKGRVGFPSKSWNEALMIVPGRHFYKQHTNKQKRKDDIRIKQPWNFVAPSLYCFTLAFSFFSTSL